MLVDVVADANVIAHAQNESVGANHKRGQRFLLAFIESDVALVLDEGEHIFGEYEMNGLTTSDHELIAAFMREIPDRNLLLDPGDCDPQVRSRITELVPGQHNDDRILLRLASVSTSKVLTSHDEGAFPRSRRAQVKASCGVSVTDGEECADMITAG